MGRIHRRARLRASTAILLFGILFLPPLIWTGNYVMGQQLKTVGFTTGHGEAGRKETLPSFANLQGNLTRLGFKTVEIKEKLSADNLAAIDILLLGSVFGKRNNYTDAEAQAVANWFGQGRRSLWVASDSDFGGGHYIVENSNKILGAVGSRLRVEPTQVLDPVANAKADYRVVANVLNTQDSEVSRITQGVKNALYHGPTILAGVTDGKWVPLETTKVENVFWVMKTSPDSKVTDTDAPLGGIFLPQAHRNGDTGSFVIMAVEIFAGPKRNGKIIVSGSAPYGGYEPLFRTEYYDVALTGPQLVLNTMQWAAEVKEPQAFSSELVIGAVAVVVVVAAGVVMALRRRRTPTA